MIRRAFIKTVAASPLVAAFGCSESPEDVPRGLQPGPSELVRIYRSTLLDDIVPFWERYGVDREYGGLVTCLTDEGELVSGEKYTYSLARGLWTFSTLYSTMEPRDSWLDIASRTYRFLVEHAIDGNGDWVYAMERDGTVTEGPVSIWSDCFACYGLIGYAAASGDSEALSLARRTLFRIWERTERDDFDAIAPFTMTPGVMKHGISMMEIVLADELNALAPDPDVTAILDTAIDRVLSCHLDRDTMLLHETVARDCSRLDTPEGRFILPGHAIECMWKIMRHARRKDNRPLIDTAARVMRRHLELGWDGKYGGIVYSRDSSGAEPDLPPYPPWRLKMWWVHTEALYGTLLAHELTGEDWCIEWYNRLHGYSFGHFPTGSGGDWRERLTREGAPTTETVNLPVKDFFHTPRMCLYALETLEKLTV